MLIYPGSDQIIKIPELRPATRTLDFGSGFYTTTNKKPAINFAIKVHERSLRSGNNPEGRFISIYNVDYESMHRELDIMHFESASEEWFDFVIANRRSTWQGKKYDVIYGPVANDTIYRTLIAFENGILSKAETIARLKVYPLFDQITFASERAISFLRFSGHVEVSDV